MGTTSRSCSLNFPSWTFSVHSWVSRGDKSVDSVRARGRRAPTPPRPGGGRTQGGGPRVWSASGQGGDNCQSDPEPGLRTGEPGEALRLPANIHHPGPLGVRTGPRQGSKHSAERGPVLGVCLSHTQGTQAVFWPGAPASTRPLPTPTECTGEEPRLLKSSTKKARHNPCAHVPTKRSSEGPVRCNLRGDGLGTGDGPGTDWGTGRGTGRGPGRGTGQGQAGGQAGDGPGTGRGQAEKPLYLDFQSEVLPAGEQLVQRVLGVLHVAAVLAVDQEPVGKQRHARAHACTHAHTCTRMHTQCTHTRRLRECCG